MFADLCAGSGRGGARWRGGGDARHSHLGGPGDEQTATVEVDEDGLPPADLVAFVIEDDVPRVNGVYRLEPVTDDSGPSWLYVFVDR